MENTRTDYAEVGKIVQGPSTSFLKTKQIDFSGPFFDLLFKRETGISRKEKPVFRKEKPVSRKELLCLVRNNYI